MLDYENVIQKRKGRFHISFSNMYEDFGVKKMILHCEKGYSAKTKIILCSK